MNGWKYNYKNYKTSSSFMSAKDKILNKNFNLTDKEREEIKSCIKDSFYQFTDFAHHQLSIRGKEAINLNHKYDSDYWDQYIKWLDNLNSEVNVNLFDWFFRTARANLEVSIWTMSSNGKEIEYLPSLTATQACLHHKKSFKQKNETKTMVASMYGRKSIEKQHVDKVVEYLIPHLYKDRKEIITYIAANCHKTKSMYAAYIKLFDEFSECDKKIVYSKLETILLSRSVNQTNKRSLLYGLRNDYLFDKFKENYQIKSKDKLNQFIQICDYADFENSNFNLIKKLINLDPSLVDNIQSSYIKSVIRYGSSRKTNKEKLVNFLKLVPNTSVKKAVLQLSQANKHHELNYLAERFPEIKKLINFA